MPTATTLPLIVLLFFLWRYTKGQILPCVLFTSVFSAASVLNLGALGIAPWLFTLAVCLVIKLVQGHAPYRLAQGANTIALHLIIVFLAYAAFAGMVYPVLFRGVTVMRIGDPGPLSWGLSNVAQLCYLFAAAVLYFITLSSTRQQLREAIDWYVRGCVVASLFAMYQLLNAVAHVPYPDAVLYSNPSHMVYRAYMINGMWRLNATFSEASEMAGFLIVGLALLGWQMLRGPLRLWPTLSFLLMFVSLLLTMSSVGYLCIGYMAFVLAVLAIRRMLRSGGLSPAKVVVGLVVLAGFITLFTLSTTAVQTVQKVFTSTLLDKKDSDSYRERTETHVIALETLAETDYLGAGWGSVRASGLFYVLLGCLGVPGLTLFLAFVGSLFLPLFRRYAPGVAPPSRDLIEKSLFGMSTLLVAMIVAGAEPVAPILWVLFGVATVACPSAPRARARRESSPPRMQARPSPGVASIVTPEIWQTDASPITLA